MDWYGKERLHSTQFTNMTIDGKIVAAYKNVDNFSFACVFAHLWRLLTFAYLTLLLSLVDESTRLATKCLRSSLRSLLRSSIR